MRKAGIKKILHSSQEFKKAINQALSKIMYICNNCNENDNNCSTHICMLYYSLIEKIKKTFLFSLDKRQLLLPY